MNYLQARWLSVELELPIVRKCLVNYYACVLSASLTGISFQLSQDENTLEIYFIVILRQDYRDRQYLAMPSIVQQYALLICATKKLIVQQKLLLISIEIHNAKVTFFTLSGTINHMHMYHLNCVLMHSVSTYNIKPLLLNIKLKHFLEIS